MIAPASMMPGVYHCGNHMHGWLTRGIWIDRHSMRMVTHQDNLLMWVSTMGMLQRMWVYPVASWHTSPPILIRGLLARVARVLLRMPLLMVRRSVRPNLAWILTHELSVGVSPSSWRAFSPSTPCLLLLPSIVARGRLDPNLPRVLRMRHLVRHFWMRLHLSRPGPFVVRWLTWHFGSIWGKALLMLHHLVPAHLVLSLRHHRMASSVESFLRMARRPILTQSRKNHPARRLTRLAMEFSGARAVLEMSIGIFKPFFADLLWRPVVPGKSRQQVDRICKIAGTGELGGIGLERKILHFGHLCRWF